MKRVTVDNRLPAKLDHNFIFALYQILRDLANGLNEITDTVMAKATHSAAITADALVKTGLCTYRGFRVTVITAVGTIDIRDGTAAGGGTIIDTIPIATAAGTRIEYAVGVTCETGIFVDFNGGATGTVVVLYEQV